MAGSWETVELAGHAVDIFTPTELRPDVALVFLPDQTQRPDLVPEFAAALERHGVPAVCPNGDDCWWLDKVEPRFDPATPPISFLADAVLPYVAERFKVSPPNVKLLGCGTGGQGAYQFAFKRPREFPAVAAIDPALDFHEIHGRGTALDDLFPDREAARQATATLRMHPAAWPRRMLLIADPQGFWFDGAERLWLKLRSSGIPVETEFADTAGGDPAAFFARHVGRAVTYLLGPSASLPVIARDEIV